MVILWIACVRDEVEPVHIIDIPVAVVIDVVSWDLTGIGPRICREIRVIIRDAGINYDSNG